jgi:hypothetical protein
MKKQDLQKLGVAGICFLVLSGSIFADIDPYTQEYEYILEMSKDDSLCNHMEKIYSEKFRYPWKSDPYYPSNYPTSGTLKPTYGSDSIYAWPKQFDYQKEVQSIFKNLFTQDQRNYGMRFSKFPTSAEFEAIEWKDIDVGLYAKFDIDNDGLLEQVVKSAFMGNPHEGGDGDWLLVFNDGRIRFRKESLKEDLLLARNDYLADDVIYEWRQIRPFIYKGHIYLHLQHDIASIEPNNKHIAERSYTLVADYYADNNVKSWVSSLNHKMTDDTRHNNKVIAEGIIMNDTPGIRKICRFYMKPVIKNSRNTK